MARCPGLTGRLADWDELEGDLYSYSSCSLRTPVSPLAPALDSVAGPRDPDPRNGIAHS